MDGWLGFNGILSTQVAAISGLNGGGVAATVPPKGKGEGKRRDREVGKRKENRDCSPASFSVNVALLELGPYDNELTMAPDSHTWWPIKKHSNTNN